MTKIVHLLAATSAIAMTGPARAHAGDTKRTAAELLGEAQLAHHRATENHATAEANETAAKTALDAAEQAHKAAEGDAKPAAKIALDKVSMEHKSATKTTTAAKKEVDKAKKAVDAADKKATLQAEKDAKVEADKQAKAAKEAEQAKAKQQPEQNGVRRPKPDGACGKAWGVFDEVSKANGSPASIGEALPKAGALGVNEATTRTQYARWRKYYGVTGRVEAPKTAEAAPVEPQKAVADAPTPPVQQPAA